jgi:hypothetical protein
MASDTLAREAPAKCYGCGKPITVNDSAEVLQAEILRYRRWLHNISSERDIYCANRMARRALNGEGL